MRVRQVVAAIAAATIMVAPASAEKAFKWRTIEADNGAVYGVDTASTVRLQLPAGAVDAIICAFDGGACPLTSMRRVRFDCNGHYMEIDGGGGMMLAPPRSVAGQLAEIVCAPPQQTNAEIGAAIAANAERMRACVRRLKPEARATGVTNWDQATAFYSQFCFSEYDQGYRAIGLKVNTQALFRALVGVEIGAITLEQASKMDLR